eukprot:CAMPEP_0202889682 /NCGR_PEP_ID=MMETSP1392-20130828/280_1 /ASSEMBLY_ACC=CAM_ASM_000868 /TAXON_ID=225041 /ORGANISM="Chlamydomonas chlamydogama, Strain SAG 11-48b" /LENGTH=71 /DNA_ID=CAMNT_0049573071 /DNA_START=21 /DNA_END=233 /DNA_ORIENTATION=-
MEPSTPAAFTPLTLLRDNPGTSDHTACVKRLTTSFAPTCPFTASWPTPTCAPHGIMASTHMRPSRHHGQYP